MIHLAEATEKLRLGDEKISRLEALIHQIVGLCRNAMKTFVADQIQFSKVWVPDTSRFWNIKNLF
jgi:hypothetical protein